MAAPITHIVLSDKVFPTFFSQKDKKAFYVGTSFPDIRYLGVIEREATHFHDLTLEILSTLPAFEAGLKFHSLVDEVRETYMQSNNVYALGSESPFITQALKFLEDKVLYHRCSHWNEVTAYFATATEKELSFGVAASDIHRWHTFLRTYFASPPNEESIRQFVVAINKPAAMAEEIIRVVRAFEKQPEVIRSIERFYEEFEDLAKRSE